MNPPSRDLAIPAGLEKLDQIEIPQGTIAAWLSRRLQDADWDAFLRRSPLGQFQQSGMWAQAKNTEGWKLIRVVFTADEQKIVGGFQMLWSSAWYGRIAYVSKGPVVLPGYPGLPDFAARILQQLSRRERLRAVIAQPPDLCTSMPASLIRSGFLPNTVVKVIDATWIIDLSQGFDAVEEQMSKWTRKKARQAIRRGVRIREGAREDIKAFFELMLSTCRRQSTVPVPADERILLSLWAAARPGDLRLTFAEYQGRPLAGLLCILHGETATFWKKGWTSSDGRLHPNEALMLEMLEWSSSKGYGFADFCALDKEIALRMLAGRPLSPEQDKSRHMFNVRLGGRPMLLPESQIYFPNVAIRFLYRTVCGKRRGEET